MMLYKIGLIIPVAYFGVTVIVFFSEMFMEYFQQKQNEIIRYHDKPTLISVLKKSPRHLKKSFLWFI